VTLLQTTTLAYLQSAQTLAANLEALRRTQPHLCPYLAELPLNVEWVFARDRTLTALDEQGQWWSGCSLPTRAAAAILSRLDVRGAVGCFLAPAHSALVRVALDKLRPEQAIVAIVPQLQDLSLMLHCEDFSLNIGSGRLWFAAGPAWEHELRRLLDAQCGLATPTSFIRTPDASPDLIDPMIATAQRVFADVNACRARVIQGLLSQSVEARASRVCVVAPSRFRLWNDLGPALLGAFDGQHDLRPLHFDCDDPCNSSPLALAKAVSQCGAIMTANTARSDLPGVVPQRLPWITWLTASRIPRPTPGAMNDHVIVADSLLRESALRAGWESGQVHVGTWPQVQTRTSPAASTKPRTLALVADTLSLDTPSDLIEYSSHSLLWEAIRHELSADSFVVREAHAYLNDRIKQHQVGDDGFPRSRFVERLIVPAYEQGLARTLLRADVPLRLFGRGWEMLDEFKPHAGGPIDTREQFGAVIVESAGLVHAWPMAANHPIETTGMPVVRCTDGRAQSLLANARLAIEGRLPLPTPAFPPLGSELLKSILPSLHY
jgi:hypothetical protein